MSALSALNSRLNTFTYFQDFFILLSYSSIYEVTIEASTINMAFSTSHTAPEDSQSRETSAFEPPTYKISYAQDQTLVWEPPVGSKELGEALSWKYPDVDGLKQKMKAAMEDFLRAERKKTSKVKRVLNAGKKMVNRMSPSTKRPESNPDASLPKHQQFNIETLDRDSVKQQLDASNTNISIEPTVERNHSSVPKDRDTSVSTNAFEKNLSESFFDKSLDKSFSNAKINKMESGESTDTSLHFFNWSPTNNDFQSTTRKRARSR